LEVGAESKLIKNKKLKENGTQKDKNREDRQPAPKAGKLHLLGLLDRPWLELWPCEDKIPKF